MRVGAGVGLDRRRRAPVRVTFAQNRVHRRALHRVIALARLDFGVGFGVFRIIGDVIALLLQFLDRRNELRHGGRNVGQFDHIGARALYDIAKQRKIIRHFLGLCQALGERRQNPSGQRDIPGPDGNLRLTQKLAQDRQQRGRGQLRGFVCLGVNDIGKGLI